jgi:hypothetical protein
MSLKDLRELSLHLARAGVQMESKIQGLVMKHLSITHQNGFILAISDNVPEGNGSSEE